MKPDFSGGYLLDRAASTLSAGADTVETAVMRIDHREPTFHCSARFDFRGGQPVEFAFERVADGRETASADTVSRFWWEGDALVSEDRTTRPDAAFTMSWRYELFDGGRRLRCTESIRGSTHDQDNVWEFRRRIGDGRDATD
jgi:hypothetical protein